MAALSPADVNYEETLSTLRFCLTAKQIQTKPVVNEDETEKLMASMRAEVEMLKAHLEAATKAGSMLQNQFLSGQIADTTLAMAQLSPQDDGNNMQHLRLETRKLRRVTAFGFAGDPLDIEHQLHLKYLSPDDTVSGGMVVLLKSDHSLSIGRSDAMAEQVHTVLSSFLLLFFCIIPLASSSL